LARTKKVGFLSLALAGSILVTAAGMWALMAWVPSGAAEANGVSSEIYNQVQGPYRLVVGISPGRPVIPQTHFAMQVMDTDQDTLLRDSDIQLFVTATGPDGSVGFGPEQTYNDLSLAYFEIDVPFDEVISLLRFRDSRGRSRSLNRRFSSNGLLPKSAFSG
jgi:hypothetical protein